MVENKQKAILHVFGKAETMRQNATFESYQRKVSKILADTLKGQMKNSDRLCGSWRSKCQLEFG
jgi:hypothetical protein